MLAILSFQLSTGRLNKNSLKKHATKILFFLKALGKNYFKGYF